MLSPTNPATSQNAGQTVFAGGGLMGQLMRSLDWSQTPLGPVETWPQSLKTSVSTCLNSRFAILVWWGKELVMLYNDAYRAILGVKHPYALGAPGKQVWPEIWHIIGPMLEGVRERSEATWSDNLLLELERNGYPEECYFTFSYSPIQDESGGVGGVFTPVHETTSEVIGKRRLRTLRDLAEAARVANAENAEAVCRAASESLAGNPHDMPFAAFYLFSEDGRSATMCTMAGAPLDTSLLPPKVERNTTDWPFAKAGFSGDTELIPISAQYRDVPMGAWPVPPREAMVLPICPAGRLLGFLLLGVSPRKQMDDDYRGFFSLIAGNITTSMADARALEQERKRAEALAELDHAKTQFFSNVSHEFRTPLTLLLGPLEDALTLNRDLPPDAAEAIRVAHRNGLRLLRLVNSLLDFSRMEAGRTNALYELTDLSTFTVELASSFRSATERAGLELTVDCPELAKPVYVDREMWEKIVLNLLSNAFKFTFEGGISIRIGEANGDVELQVSDTGIGIPETELPHLFERFHRVQSARGRTYEGTGIGLALVKELVCLHGGTLRAESELGKGSTFFVSLPFGKEHLPPERIGQETHPLAAAVRADSYVEEALRWLPDASGAFTDTPEFARLPATPSNGDAAVGKRAKILLVDDNAEMRDYICRLLGTRYEVITAANGIQALERALAEQPDLVLSDIMMPGLDGFALVRALRGNVSTGTTPVLLLSARAGEEERSEGLDTGADDYLVKPFGARELLARVGAHLKSAQARKEAEEQAKRCLILESRKWRDLFAQVPAAVGVLRGPEHRFEWVNADYVRLVNRSAASELLGKPIREALPELAAQRIHDLFDHVYQSGAPYAEREAHLFLGIEDSQEIFVSFVCLPTRDSQGKIEGVFVHATDVTDLVLARKRVEESEQQFRTLAETIPHLAWMADETGHIFWYNRRWYEYTGASNLDWQQFHDPARLPGILTEYTHSVISGEPFEMIFPLRSASGEFREFLTRMEPVKDQAGKVVRWFGTNTDISEQQKTADELRRVNRELEEFAYVASHDLREPLRMVNIYTQMIMRRLSSENQLVEGYAGFVRQGVARMEALIDDLLTFSRTIRKEEFPAGDANLADALNEALALLRSTIEETDAVITCSALPTVRGDASQYTHVFLNLLSNALKYRKSGTRPRIDITAEPQGDEWIISVSDNGIGFEQQYAQRIFGLFKRLHKEQYPGTGLGLAICQRIVERYGGRIWAEGQAAGGAVFHFALHGA